MLPAPEKRARGHIGRGALLSFLLHAQLLVPLALAAFIYGGREEAQRAEEVDVGFESVPDEQLPADLPPLEPPTPDDQSLDALKPDAKKPPKDRPKPIKPTPDTKVAEKDKPKPEKPEPEVVVPPLPPMPETPPPPPPPERHDHEKMVDLDNAKDVPPPPDAKYLAQKNNRADVETRATETNLQKNQTGESAPASEPSKRDDEQVGGDKERVAQLADVKSSAGKKAPSVTPHENPELSSPDDRREKSLLALRNPAPRTHEVTPETADPSLPRAADGDLQYARPTTRGADSRADRARAKQVKLAITGSDYEYMFGADAEADRRLAKQLKSTRAGKFKERQARLQSALENFIPEVRPGNQTELNTRAAPFAAFVARMHRSIHALWGFGQIEDWDELSSSSPFNNNDLETTLEMVLNGDGTISKITIVRASGYLPYDAAAIDVAYTAGPFPDPPREIRSKNGKIYIHWRFYRDGRQCATSGVDYFILDNAPAGGDQPAVPELGSGPAPRVPTASRTPAEDGPRHLRRDLGDDAHRAKMRALDEEVARAEGAGAESGESGPAPAAASAPVAEAQAPAARAAAKKWFGALATGDVAAMTALAETPFRTTGGAVVQARGDLGPMLADLAGELGRRGVGDVQLFTPAGLRAVIGHLPPGLDDSSGLVFALVQPREGDALIAALAKRGDGYRVVAFVRR